MLCRLYLGEIQCIHLTLFRSNTPDDEQNERSPNYLP